GDRSENADYQYNKKRLREIDRRVRYLRKALEDHKVVDYSPQQDGRVFFGAWVEVENDAGDSLRFRIVGYDEIFGRNDYISIDSPMARALLKAQVDDEVVVNTPAGKATWYVNAIDYVKEPACPLRIRCNPCRPYSACAWPMVVPVPNTIYCAGCSSRNKGCSAPPHCRKPNPCFRRIFC